ncbi:MAG: YbhB/YbcL family Raf kinase inhibitor-like protein [Candidatus Levybacteria bacterium]|nr:YbhB/YbcL family Raf kinase inhibitor-like protein [Candidatus Levybacteria bacterium]
MKIASPAFLNNAKIPSEYTCDDENISPPLQFIDVPRDTQSLVLIVDDPDAPAKTWVHWVVYNIDRGVQDVRENSIPKGGILGMTDFGRPGWGGPCPPSGSHRYFFKLYALDRILDLPEGMTKQQLLEKMSDHVLEQAQLIGIYSRK